MVYLNKMIKRKKIANQKKLFKRFSVGLVAVVIGISFSLTPAAPQAEAVSLDEYNRQLEQLQNEINQYQAQARDLRSRGDTIQIAVNAINSDIAVIQAQIDITQTKINQLQLQIQQNEQKISNGKSQLGDTIANMYVDDKISPLEMLASSKNISEYVDKQEFRASVRDQLTKTIAEIKKAKKELEKQKKDVEFELAQQQTSRDALASKRAEQQQLLDQTRGDEAAYQRLSADKKAAKDRLNEQYQAALRAAFGGGSRVLAQGAAGDYPWNASNCPMIGYYSTKGANGNGGDGYGYGCRQCASYAAWRVAKETGRYPTSWGNATDFPQSARDAGYGTGRVPLEGRKQLGVMHQGKAGVPEGHVVYVESVVGSSLIISQYNYNYGGGYGMYSKMEASASDFDEYIYL